MTKKIKCLGLFKCSSSFGEWTAFIQWKQRLQNRKWTNLVSFAID